MSFVAAEIRIKLPLSHAIRRHEGELVGSLRKNAFNLQLAKLVKEMLAEKAQVGDLA